MKKIIVILSLSVFIFSVSKITHASIVDDLLNKIQNLNKEISVLRSEQKATALALPDFTVGNIGPIRAEVGGPNNIYATVYNKTSYPTPRFYFSFKIASEINGGGTITTLGPSYHLGILANKELGIGYKYIFTKASSYSMSACADSTNIVAESNEENNCSSWVNIDVGIPEKFPDLVALAPTPKIAYIGEETALKSVIKNISSANSTIGGLFSNKIEIKNSKGEIISPLDQSSFRLIIKELKPLESKVVTLPFVFTTAGTYYTRGCANVNIGSEVEADKTNNCSDWTNILVKNRIGSTTNTPEETDILEDLNIDSTDNTKIDYCSANPLFMTLSIRNKGEQVKLLQEILNSLGYLNDNNIDSVFGNITKLAVISFQRANGLTPDGIVGVSTRNFLNKKWQEKCSGILTSTMNSSVINGGWSDWVNSGSCVNGIQKQIRACTNPTPTNGGANCGGNTIRDIECELKRDNTITTNSENIIDTNVCSISKFDISNTIVTKGQSVTLSWETSGCGSLIITSLGKVLNSSGSKVLIPTSTTSFSLVGISKDGKNAVISDKKTITVNP